MLGRVCMHCTGSTFQVLDAQGALAGAGQLRQDVNCRLWFSAIREVCQDHLPGPTELQSATGVRMISGLVMLGNCPNAGGVWACSYGRTISALLKEFLRAYLWQSGLPCDALVNVFTSMRVPCNL